MLKLSITLPNNVLITLESDGTEPVHDVLSLILNSMQTDGPARNDTGVEADIHIGDRMEKSNGVPGSDTGARRGVPPGISNGIPVDGLHVGIPGPAHDAHGNGRNGYSSLERAGSSLDLNRYSSQARQDFVAFCEAVNPTGDMRRVVVATEAADRFFGLEGVTADEVGELFDLIGWRRANNFTQTIRNAARSKFGWLERIPGRAGRYAATDVGRSTTLAG